MIQIKEFLADPTGPDTGAEYISLFNNGDVSVSLAGWSLKDKSGKTFNLSGYSLESRQELKLFSSATKIILNNSDETVSLFNSAQELADELVLSGKAITGQATMKFDQLTFEVRAKLFDDLAGSSLPRPQEVTAQVFGFWFIISFILALVSMFVMRTLNQEKSLKNLIPENQIANLPF
ncbi:MAG: lamin tail domain-containing protein [bacterium]|nr:lamin tail domain-containing protein [bacterium]